MLARDLMTTNVAYVTVGTSLKRAIQIMIDRDVSGLPVVDDAGGVCGMLTEGDLLTRHEFNGGHEIGHLQPDVAFFESYIKQHGRAVGDCMTANVVAASPQATLAEIVALMRRHNIKRIPILTNGRLSGIVSRRDVLKAICATPDPVARGDDALRLAVSTRLQAELGLRREKVEVNVRDSVVEVIGEFESDAACEAVRIVTEAIAGASCIVTRKARSTAAH